MLDILDFVPTISKVTFEWDSAKSASNESKRGSTSLARCDYGMTPF